MSSLSNDPTPRTAPTTSVLGVSVGDSPARLVSWRAVLAGCVVALSVHILITMLGVGLGLSFINPLTTAEPAEAFSIGAGIAWSVSALIAMWVGGWIAGRSIDAGERGTGILHGVLVWSLSTVVVFVFLSRGAGMLASGTARAVGQGLAVSTQAVGNAAGAVADEGGVESMLQQLTPSGGLVNELLGGLGGGQAQGRQGGQAQGQAQPVSAISEVGLALIRFLGDRTDTNRGNLVTALAENSGMSRPQAETQVQEWEQIYEQRMQVMQELRAQAEQAAREAAATAAGVVTQAAIWTFVAFMLGAASAALGARSGAISAIRSREEASQP